MSQSLAGCFLIAAKHLRDPNFHRTIVLVVEHNKNGAMGLIINRPSPLTVAKALQGHFDLPETGALVYTGGPVEKAALFILHNSGEFDGNESPVVPGLFVGNSAEVFEEIVRTVAGGDQERLRFRIYSGCAGWSPGQLDRELANGDWYHCSANASAIFHEDPYEVYDQICQQMSEQHHFLPQKPVNPECN